MLLLSEALCVPSNCGMYISLLFWPLSSDVCTFGVSCTFIALSCTFISLSCAFISAAALTVVYCCVPGRLF